MKVVEFTPNAEGTKPIIEEQSSLQTTVGKELDFLGKQLVELINISNVINCTNTVAKADVIVGGTIVLKQVPATGLLELEKYLTAFKATVSAAPTLDPAKGFTPDLNQGPGVYKAREVTKTRTSKEKVTIELSKATDKFPANVQLIDKDVPTGTIRQNEWSGMLTPAGKAVILDRIENLTNAVKEACSRANSVEIIGEKIGQDVLNYILV